MAKEEEGYIKQKIRHIPYTKDLTIYSISDEELNALSKGLHLPLYLNFSIFFLSFSGSLIGSMLPTILGQTSISKWIWCIFILACVFFIAGIVLLIIWISRGKKVNEVLKEIKTRKPSEGTPADE